MRKRVSILRILSVFTVLTYALVAVSLGQVDVLTHHNDTLRTGANLSETILNTANVNLKQFGKLFSYPVDGQIYAQPLYMSNVNIPNRGAYNVVYVATMENSVYAFDADGPSDPLWQKSLGPFLPPWIFPYLYDIIGPIGILSTPVIDRSSGTLYVVAENLDGEGNFHFWLHALDVRDGEEKFGGPVEIQASMPSNAPDAVNGVLAFDPGQHLQRPGLLLLDGVVYIAFGSHGDADPYHGWMMGYDAKTLQSVAVFNSTPNGDMGAIWQSGQAPMADSDGNIYIMTANGSTNIHRGGANVSYGVIKLDRKLSILDWFVPYNIDTIFFTAEELSTFGPLQMPGTNLLIAGSKLGLIYLMDKDNLGQFRACEEPCEDPDGQLIQRFQGSRNWLACPPVVWTDAGGSYLYIMGAGDYLRQFQLADGRFQTTALATSPDIAPGWPGGMLSLSANGNEPGTGILWAVTPFVAGPTASGGGVFYDAGVLKAFDASDVSVELWNSRQDLSRDDFGSYVKFTPPTIANGKVYLATSSRQLVVYGLLSE